MEHHRACHLCEAICGVVIEHDGDRLTGVRGDPDDPLSRGYLCPKATALVDLHHDPDRLKTPLRRTAGGDFEPVDWETALALTAERLAHARRQHGPRGVAFYVGNPTVHNLGALLGMQAFGAALKSHNRYSATSVDQLPKMLASLQMYGHQLLISVPDVDRCDLFIVFGANPLVSNGSLMTAPGMKRRLDAIRARGGRVVVFDPRRTETARVADEHHFVRPGTDALVLFAMVHTVFEEGLVRLGRFAPHVADLDTLRTLAREFAPERTEAVTGVSAVVVRRLTRALADTGRAAVYGRMGVSVTDFGGLSNWLIEVLNVLTGHFDEPGGMMFSSPAADLAAVGTLLGQRGSFGRIRSRVRGAPGFSGELPAACLAEEIDTPGDGQVRALVTLAGNPVLSTPNGARLERALPSLEFMVSIDPYVNETTRHAHVILPPTFGVEREHYDLAFHGLAVRNTARWSDPIRPREASQRHDWEILSDLSARLAARGNPLRERALRAAASVLTPARIVDLALRAGPYRLTRAKVAAAPSGVDLGALVSVMPGRLQTRDGVIPLAPRCYVDDVPRLRAWWASAEARAPSQLVLIGRRGLRSNNSWGHNSVRLVKGPVGCTLRIHPDDAKARGLAQGDVAVIASRVGEVRAPVEVSDEVMRGVVSLPHGWGHHREGVRMRVAAAHAGVSANDLTDDAALDAMSGNAVLNGVPVTVTRAEGATASV